MTTTPPPTIPVTQPTLPSLADLTPLLEEIWENRILTNGGPLHERLEQALKDYLDVDYITLFNNGTTGLMAAAKALSLTGDVVTTPFSFVATAHALVWNGLRPIFVDINEHDFNLNSRLIAKSVSGRTSAVLPVHCYGTPCDVKGIAEIAEDLGLKVIYDAAHAFDVRPSGSNLLNYGDLSVLSFHATKAFSTIEGGAVVCHDAEMKRRLDLLRNFGFHGETSVTAFGINGKMSEVHAAFGLAQLPHLEAARKWRKTLSIRYRRELAHINGIEIPQLSPGSGNFSYFPMRVTSDYPVTRDVLQVRLRAEGILARRYFYPLIPDFQVYVESFGRQAGLDVARRVSEQILCLPIYGHMSLDAQDRVLDVIGRASS